MEKIYGYKETDVIGLAEFIKERKNQTLSSAFEEYGAISGKAKGTVRNLYYALAKLSSKDKGFCDKYFSGKPLAVNKIVEFDQKEERELIKEILLLKKDGCSVRGAIAKLTNGDDKKALRYQNKYRNAIKNKPNLISELILELKGEGHNVEQTLQKTDDMQIGDGQFRRLKSEVNKIVESISFKLKKENQILKARINSLELENIRLSRLLYGRTMPSTSIKFLRGGKSRELIN